MVKVREEAGQAGKGGEETIDLNCKKGGRAGRKATRAGSKKSKRNRGGKWRGRERRRRQ